MKDKKKIIVHDCDGVFLGRTRERNENDNCNCLEDYSELFSILGKTKKRFGYEMIALTDRGGAQLPPISYVLQSSRYQGGESGAVAYDNYSHRIIKNPSYMEIILAIREIEHELNHEFRYFYPLEPGVYSSIRAERVDGQDMSPVFDWLSEKAKKSAGQLLCADHGDCISLKPIIDKGLGSEWLFSLYEKAGIKIDFTNSIWIGDGTSDIPAARFIHERGGQIAGVANSHEKYREFILQNGGYIAKAQQTAGMVEIIKQFVAL